MIRDAVAADADTVVALVESAYRGDSSRVGWTTEADLLEGRRTDADAVLGLISRPDSAVLLMTSEAELLACCHIERRSETTAYFGMFAVVPGRQGSGIGRKLLAIAEESALQRWGSTVMEMTVLLQRDELIAWYARRGYHPTGDTKPFMYGDSRFGDPLRDDLQFVVLSKPLIAAEE